MAQPSHRLSLAAVFSSCLGVGLIFGFQPPLIALALSRLGYSSFAIGAVTAASLIAVILCGPFYPRAIIRLGLKRCIVSGIVFAAALLLLMPLRPSVPFWLILRFVAGCALGLVWIASEIWMNSVSTEGFNSRTTATRKSACDPIDVSATQRAAPRATAREHSRPDSSLRDDVYASRE